MSDNAQSQTTENTQGTGASQVDQQGGTNQQPGSTEPPAWFKAHQEEVNGKLSKLTDDFIGMRKKFSKGQSDPSKDQKRDASETPENNAPEALSWTDQRALAKLEASLPEASLKWLDERAEGLPLSQRKLLAEALAQGKGEMPNPPQDRSGGTPTTGTRGGTPPSKTSGPVVTTMEQYRALSKEQRRAVTDDPNFDYRKLR